jgi:hypothetical protein
MFRPPSPPRPTRRGAILIVVLALLALFAVVGLSLVFYADSEANAARIHREGAARPDPAPPDANLVANKFLGTLVFDTGDTGADLNNALRGHGLLRAMYGWTDSAGAGHTIPFNGLGTFHEPLDLSATFGLPPGSVVLPDRARVVNYTLVPWGPFGTPAAQALFVLDPEYTGYRDQTSYATAPGYGGSRAYVGRNAPYTYPDLKDFYLASISPRTGEVLVPSFHRSWLFNGTDTDPGNTDESVRLAPWDPTIPTRAGLTDWVSTEGRTRIVRPRPVDQLTDAELASVGLTRPIVPANLSAAQLGQLFQLINGKVAAGEVLPYPAPNADGSYTGDVQNLTGGVGAQRNDSLLLDVGMPVMRWNGKLVKPLVAALVLDHDGRLNYSAHGNPRHAGGYGHASGGGYGPWEVNPGVVLGSFEGMSVALSRGIPEARAGAGVANPYRYDRSFGPPALPAYALVNWDGSAIGIPWLPDFAMQTALRTVPRCPNGYTDNQTQGIDEASNHAGLFNPSEWPASGGLSNRVFARTDFRRLNLRYAPPPDSNALLDVGPFAPDSLKGTTTTGPKYRLDPAHPNRLMVTPLGATLDRPMLTPNFAAATPALRLNGESLSHGVTSQSSPQPTASSAGDYGPGAARNVRAALGPVDLNRPLADYRDLTAPPNVDPMTGQLTPQPLGPANMANHLRAWADRHNLARDIYARLVVATGAMATVDVSTGDVTVNADPKINKPEFDALRYLAQVAVNIVDYIDPDDISTPFIWNPAAGTLGAITDPQQMTAFVVEFTPAQIGSRVVFGVEKTRLVLNEVYSEIVNDPDEVPGDDGPKKPAQVRFWVELLNPTSPPYLSGATGPLGDGTVYLPGVYQLQVARQRTAGGSTAAGNLREPGNVRGGFLSVTPDIVFDFNRPNVPGVRPNGAAAAPGDYDPAGNPALGIALFGPPAKAGPANVEWVPDTRRPPFANMIASADPSGVAGATQNALAYNLDIAEVTDEFLGNREALRHVVLLRRLANPHLPPNDPAGAFNPALPANVYVTVDYLDWVPSLDAVTWTKGSGKPRGKGKGLNTKGYDPIEERFAVGKVQPYTSSAFSPKNANPDDYPTFTYPASYVLAQNPGGGTKPRTEPRHTFGRHNGTAAAGAAYTAANCLPANPAETIALPFDWYVQPDRTLANQLELLWVPWVAPHRVTQYPPRGDDAVRRTYAQVPWMTQDAPLYRALELLRVKPWGYAAALGGRVHGRVNLNTAQDAQILAALADPQGGNGFSSADVTALWTSVVGSTNPVTNVPYRTATHRTRYLADGTAVSVPVPGRTVDDDPYAAPDVPLDRPFKALGVGQFGVGGNYGLTLGGGVHDTLLRPEPGTLTPLAWLSPSYTVGSGNMMAVVDRSHPYFRSEAARKLMNNVTTVSNTFTVTFTVVFHEVRTHGHDPLTEAGTGRPLLGKELYREVPGDLRQQFFAVIDRGAAALDPTSSTTLAADRPFFTTLEAPAVPASPPPSGVPYTTSRLSLAYGAFDPVAGVMTVYADGVPVTVSAGSRLVLGVGAEQEVVTVAADVPFNPDGTVNVYGSGNAGVARPHAAGTCVSNARPGNPGPQPTFDRLTNPNGSYGAIIPFVVRVR